MKNRKIRRDRTMSYFINATEEIISEEGIGGVTIRKVADKAGFNSATLYNYFENLDHLIFFAAMKHIKDYASALKIYLRDSKNAMDRFLKVWECFCDYSYDQAEIYSAIFFPHLDNDMEYYVDEYYKLFPHDLIDTDSNTSTMLLKSDINERGMTTIIDCIDEGYIKKEDADKLNNITLLIYEGMLRKVMRGKISYDDARNETMDYIKSIVEGFLIKEYEFYY